MGASNVVRMQSECSRNGCRIRFDVRASKNSNKMQLEYLEVYKIIHDMYGRSVALELPRNVSSTRRNNINCKTTAFITTFENFLLLHELLTCGTVYRIM